MNRKQTKKSRKSISLGAILLFVGVILALVCVWKSLSGKTSAEATQIDPTADLLYVVADSTLSQVPVSYPGMEISFNPDMHLPNWAAWELTAAEVDGQCRRENKFYSDQDVPGCAESYDYNYSGYDRGHMVPAGDMKWSREAMHASFSMVNICPQAKSLNTGAWKSLEEKCRTWAKRDSALIIICGPVLSDPVKEWIGDSRVAVPKRFFKVILAPYASPVRGIGFLMSNGLVRGGMQAAAVSIDEVERATGLDFFSALPDEIEKEVEQQCDFHYWSSYRKR